MIELGLALYANRGKEIKITTPPTAVGKVGIAGLKTSSYRGGVSTAPKMSAIGTLFDLLLLVKGSLAAYVATDGSGAIYCEYDDTKAIAYGNRIIYSEDKREQDHLLIPDVIWELSDYGSNKELKDTFISICETYSATGTVQASDVFLFCDSYWYGCAKDKNKIDEQKDLDDEQVKAAFRSGLFKPHPLFQSCAEKYMKKSAFATEEKKAGKKKGKKKEDGTFLQECKDGKYRVAYEWPEEVKSRVVPVTFLDGFETTPEFEEIVRKIKFRTTKVLERMDMGLTGADAIGKDYMNIMLIGKPGTGKTTLAYALSAATGIPVCTTAWNKHSDETEVEGKTAIVDGAPKFVETDSLIFHEYGGIDVNEEVNLADPSVTMGSLGQKVEYPFIVKRNGYETKVRHPLNIVIATMNVGTNGSNPLNQALANRFKNVFILDDPTRETFINILEKASKKSRAVCEWVYTAYEETVRYLKDPSVNEEDICQNLSIRTCLGAIENMEEGQDPIRAIINSIVGAVAAVDLEVARKLQHEKIECLVNPHFSEDEFAA